MTRKRLMLALLLVLAAASVTTTYTRLSLTADEAFHMRCGMEWWRTGEYTIEPLHPPLARLMTAALPYWAGIQTSFAYSSPDAYLTTNFLSRLGILPFYLFSCAVVFIWGKRLFGAGAALWSLALYATLPTVAAHAGLATTDMGYTAMLLWALMAAVEWLQCPTRKRAILAGISLGLAVGSKFSALVHFPAAMLLILMVWCIHNRKRALPFPVCRAHVLTGFALVVPSVVLALGLLYHFSFDALFAGIHQLWRMNITGQAIWMFGPLHNHAVWYFFPVLFFFKTPLPFHIATLIGNMRIIRTRAAIECIFPLLAALAILLSSMPSHINLGVRHILPVFPLLAIPAGYGLWLLWQGQRWKRALAACLLLWQAWSLAASWPDRISYYNELAGAHPEYISLDSDFDWGQGVLLLGEAVQRHHIDSLQVCLRKLHINALSAKILLHTQLLACPDAPATGWIAVSRSAHQQFADKFTWLSEAEAVEQVGKTIDLYYIPAP